MARIRGKHSARIFRDPRTGRDRVLNESFEDDVLNGPGGLDTHAGEVMYPLDCGCLAAAAGRCHLCGALSCPKCHGRCVQCQAPMCLEHSVFAPTGTGGTQRYCKSCHDQHRRTRRLMTCVKAVLSPFVQWEARHGKR